jgi:hypothetical protein
MYWSILCILFFIGVVLSLLFYLYYFKETKEGFACIAREYVKVEEEEGETSFEPIQMVCASLDDSECKKFKADCVEVDIDEELFYNEDEESNILLNMFESCIKPDTYVKMDTACFNRSITQRGNVGSRNRITNLNKCILKNEKPNYYFDDKCEMLF